MSCSSHEKTRAKLKCILLSEDTNLRRLHIIWFQLHHTFWKRQNFEISKKIWGCYGLGGGRNEEAEHRTFQRQWNYSHDTIMVETSHYTFIETNSLSVIQYIITRATLSCGLPVVMLCQHKATSVTDVPLWWGALIGGTAAHNPRVNAGDEGAGGWSPGSGRATAVGNGSLSQDSCLENSKDRGVWQATVCGAAEGWTRLRNWTQYMHNVRGYACVRLGQKSSALVTQFFCEPKTTPKDFQKYYIINRFSTLNCYP